MKRTNYETTFLKEMNYGYEAAPNFTYTLSIYFVPHLLHIYIPSAKITKDTRAQTLSLLPKLVYIRPFLRAAISRMINGRRIFK